MGTWIKKSQVKSFWRSTFVKHKKTNFLQQSNHWCIPTPIRFSLHNYYYYLVACALVL
jgi:hypothetical protein